MSPFEVAFEYLMKNEGQSFTNDPMDSGGPTKFGITLKLYQVFKDACFVADDISKLTIDDAKEFYRAMYWDEIDLDEIKSLPTQICLFDTSVLYGPNTAVILAQRTVSMSGATLKFDGIMGDRTIEAINLVKPEEFVKSYHLMVMRRINTVVMTSPKNKKFLQGWVNRADRLLTLV